MSTASQPADPWEVGAAYEPYVGRWSRLVAAEFLAWLAVPPGRRWLDVGCGTGALSQTILERAAPAAVLGVDPSAGFVAYARSQVADPRAGFEVGDARHLPVPDAALDAVVSGLVLNFVPPADQAGALAELRRAVVPGGTVAAYVWDYAGEMQLMRHFWDAAVALDPTAQELDEGRRFPLCRPEPLAELFRGAGLGGVAVRAIDVPTRFRDFDDYWTPFLGGQGPAPGYATSLSDERRAALRERIRAGLPVAPDGSIPLIARAWAVQGKRWRVSQGVERACGSPTASSTRLTVIRPFLYPNARRLRPGGRHRPPAHLQDADQAHAGAITLCRLRGFDWLVEERGPSREGDEPFVLGFRQQFLAAELGGGVDASWVVERHGDRLP